MNIHRIARKLCKRSTHSFAFHSAILLRGGAIVSTGYNCKTRHAEEKALLSLWPSECSGTTLWTIRFTKTGKMATGKPCVRCQALAKYLGVKSIYYSMQDGIHRMKL